MARADKVAMVDEIAEEFRSSSGAVLTEYRGLSVAQLKDLRRALGEHATYAVVKNTLTKLAADQAGVTGVSEHLVGPTAIAFVKGDVVEAAKSLRDFSRANATLVIKGGVLDGRVITTAEIAKLADLESRDTLLARLAGGMSASLQQAVSLFAAPLSQAARVLAALEQKRSDDEPDPGPVAVTEVDLAAADTAAEADTEPAPAAEASAGSAAEAAPAAEASAGSAAEADTEAAPAAEASDESASPAAPAAEASAGGAAEADTEAAPAADASDQSASQAAPAAETTDQG
jgi:large subunit ribosomal protein L10